MATLTLLDREPRAGRCRGCGADILWAVTENGRAMILDKWEPTSKPDGEGLVTIDSSATHWASCPERSRFLRRP